MSPRLKKLVGLGALLPGLAVYLFAAAAVGVFVPNHPFLKFAYYLVAGIAWVFPVRRLLRWANRDPSQNGT